MKILGMDDILIDIYNIKNTKDTTLRLGRVIINHKNYDKRLLVSELGSVYKYNNIVT